GAFTESQQLVLLHLILLTSIELACGQHQAQSDSVPLLPVVIDEHDAELTVRAPRQAARGVDATRTQCFKRHRPRSNSESGVASKPFLEKIGVRLDNRDDRPTFSISAQPKIGPRPFHGIYEHFSLPSDLCRLTWVVHARSRVCGRGDTHAQFALPVVGA